MKEWKLDDDDQKDDNYPLFYHLIRDQILVVTYAKKDRGILVALLYDNSRIKNKFIRHAVAGIESETESSPSKIKDFNQLLLPIN